MTAVLYSQLNPLANAFIPTNSELSLRKAIQLSIESENEANTTWEGKGKLNSNDQKSEYKITQETTVKLDCQYVLWQDIVSSSVTSELNVLLNSSTMGQTTLDELGGSPLPMLPECLTDEDQELILLKSKADTTLKTLMEENECNCPPMFGWTIPPDFIGNPFNYKYKCSKKYPHSPNYTAKLESDTLDYLDTEINQWTLDECLSEMKDILVDVYETISDSDPITKWDEKYKIQDYLEVSDSDSSDEENESNDSATEFSSHSEIEPELVDDGVHPLLQSRPTACEDEKICIENIAKILSSLSSPLPAYYDAETRKVGAACNPPCSEWCESSPSATGCRPIFKRSLSADDAPMYDQICRSLNRASEVESREMLLLRRKDPLNYYRTRSSDTLTKRKKHGSCDLTDRQLFTESNMWGKFDGADSLWKPLPECIAVNAHKQKLNLKKGRETRLQRTIS